MKLNNFMIKKTYKEDISAAQNGLGMASKLHVYVYMYFYISGIS